MENERRFKPAKMLDRKTFLKERSREEMGEREKELEKKARLFYVKGGHFKNELLGTLTVLSFDRALDVAVIRGVRYAPGDRTLYLNVYQPEKRDPKIKLPVFVYIHGGGWIGGSPENREAYTTRIAAAGFFVVSLYYGHSPEYPHPKPIQNIYKAFAWLKENAALYNVDADEIFVGGESAGAHLSSMVGAVSSDPRYNASFALDEHSRRQKVRGLVLNCGVYDIEKAYGIPFKNIQIYIDSFCGKDFTLTTQEEKDSLSTINHLTADFPPTFAISAENDKLQPLTYEFVSKLDSLGVDVRHFEGTGKLAVHAFAVAPVLDVAKDALAKTGAFLEDVQKRAGKDYPVPCKDGFILKRMF